MMANPYRTRREALVFGASSFLVAAVPLSCRANPPLGPVALGRSLLRLDTDRLTVEIHEWTRNQKRQGRVVVATCRRGTGARGLGAQFEVVPASTPQANLAFATPASGSFAAINGGFYDANNKPMGVVRHLGVDHSRLRAGGGSGVMLQTKAGARLVHRDEKLPPPEDAPEALQSIDRLVVDSASVVGLKASKALDARSAVAIDTNGRVVLVALFADAAVETERGGTGPRAGKGGGPASKIEVSLGQQSTETGVTLGEFAALLASEAGFKARSALNLDGGFSVGMAARVNNVTVDIRPHRATINAVRIAG